MLWDIRQDFERLKSVLLILLWNPKQLWNIIDKII